MPFIYLFSLVINIEPIYCFSPSVTPITEYNPLPSSSVNESRLSELFLMVLFLWWKINSSIFPLLIKCLLLIEL